MMSALHPHWRSTGPQEAREEPAKVQQMSPPSVMPADTPSPKRREEPDLLSSGSLRRMTKLHPLTTSLIASIVILLLSSLFTVGVRSLRAQLVEQNTVPLRVTTQGWSPAELSLAEGDSLTIEWLHPNAGTVQSQETDAASAPLLRTKELQMGQKERIVISPDWKRESLTLVSSVHPDITATVLLASGEQNADPSTPIPALPTPPPVPSASPTPPTPAPPPVPHPTPLPPSPVPTPLPIVSSPVSPEATLEAPILPRTTSAPVLRTNRYTVGSPLVPGGALPPVPLAELSGIHGAAPLHGITYPEMVLTPPAVSPHQQFIPPPPSPRVPRQPETGPFLGGLAALCAVVSVLLVLRRREKKMKGKQ